jgi:hypothetical protein
MTKGPSLSPPQLMPFLEPHGVMLYLLEGKIPKPDENWFMTNQDRQVENESTLLNKRIVLLGGSSGIGLLSHGKLWSRGRMRLLHQAIKRAFNKLLIALAARPKGVGSIFPTILLSSFFFGTWRTSIILSTRPVTLCNWTSLRQWTSRKPGELSNFAFGQL